MENNNTTGGVNTTHEQHPELFTDPIRVDFKLTKRAMERDREPEGYVFECICYPHTPTAEFETILPDGYHVRSWDDSIGDDKKHAWMMFSVSLALDHTLIDENRYGEVFPAAEQLEQREHEEEEKARQEYLASHPNAANEPMKVTMTASEPRF